MAKKKGKIDNFDEIKRRTGYEPGKLYYRYIEEQHQKELQEEVDYYKGTEESKKSMIPGTGVILDVTSFNFHMIPTDINLSKKLSAIIKNKQQEIKKEWEGCKNKEGLKLITCGNGTVSHIDEVSPYKNDNCHLFHYLLFENDAGNKYYYINLMRFFCDVKNESVNCILACLQFDCCHIEADQSNLENQYVYCRGICCPTNDKPSEDGKNIQKNSIGNFSYNPKASFYLDTPKIIIEEFKEFIKKVEQSEKNNI